MVCTYLFASRVTYLSCVSRLCQSLSVHRFATWRYNTQNTIHALRTGIIANDLIAVATAAIAKKQTVPCVECATHTAQVWCLKCQVALCSNCHSVTHASRLYQAHALETMERRGEQPRALPKCPAHPQETVSFIARDGITLMCRDCVLIGADAGGAPSDLVEVFACWVWPPRLTWSQIHCLTQLLILSGRLCFLSNKLSSPGSIECTAYFANLQHQQSH